MRVCISLIIIFACDLFTNKAIFLYQTKHNIYLYEIKTNY